MRILLSTSSYHALPPLLSYQEYTKSEIFVYVILSSKYKKFLHIYDFQVHIEPKKNVFWMYLTWQIMEMIQRGERPEDIQVCLDL